MKAWKDERLTWDTREYKLEEVVVSVVNIWQPEFAELRR